MKKTFLLSAIGLTVALTLAGCGEKPVDTVNNNGTTNVADQTNKNVDTGKSNETVKNTETKTDNSLAPYFQTADVEYQAPLAIDNEVILKNYKQEMIDDYSKVLKGYDANSAPASWSNIVGLFNFFEVGTLKKAPYNSWKLVVLGLGCDGPCHGPTIYRFAYDEKNDKLVMLAQNSSTETAEFMGTFLKKADQTFAIGGLIMPKNIILPANINGMQNDGKQSINLESPDVSFDTNIKTAEDEPMGGDDLASIEIGKIAFKDEKIGNFYFSTYDNGCLFVKLPDGTISRFAYDPKIFKANDDENNSQKSETNIVSTVNWNDKSKSTDLNANYSQLARGCGIDGKCYFLENVKAEELEKVGTTNQGVDLMMLKNPQQVGEKDTNASPAMKDLSDTYDNYAHMWQYTDHTANSKQMNFAEFVALKPVLYWKDPFGRFAAIIRNEVKPQVECGKPVIYLYPQKTTDVSVKVGIEKFTKTVPAYGNDGWKVKAEPDGKLMNYADGQNYPYLFWEGTTSKAVPFDKGFMVAREDLEKFLQDSLVKLGLNYQEKSDFIAFWLPKMRASTQAYFLVSFIGTSEFNKVAPLEISPKPDTLIRVFMYYRPLNAAAKIQPEILKAIPRRGFTVVEWGGTSTTGWQIQ